MENEIAGGRRKLPIPLDSGILYTVVAIYYTYLSRLITKINLPGEIDLLLSEIVFLALPAFLLAAIRKYDIKKTFRFKAPRPLEVLLMLVISPIMIIAGFCAGFIALYGVKMIFGRVIIAGDVTNIFSNGLLVSMLLVAVLPAVCEEILFRGMIQRGIERLGTGWAVFLSGLLFGLFHFDFQRLAAQTLIGFISAYVVIRTGSIFNGMILHFMNNGLLTLLSSYAIRQAPGNQTVTETTDPFSTPQLLEQARNSNMTLDQLLGTAVIVLTVILLISLFAIFGLLLVVRAMTQKTFEKPEKIKGSAKGLLVGIPGLLLIGVVYTALGLILLNNDLGRQLLHLVGIA